MAGTVDLMQRAYTGIEVRGDVLHFNPNLPEGMRRLRFSLRYRRHLVEVEITQDKLVLNSQWRSPEPLELALRGVRHQLLPCETREFPIARPPVTAEGALDGAGP
jgi:alpha,alpha-trehalase